MKSLFQILDEIGYDVMIHQIIGQDPYTLAIRGLVIGRNRQKPNEYAVWSTFDWSQAAPRDRKRGIDVQWGTYSLGSYEEAYQLMCKKAYELRTNYTWLEPGTKKEM